MKVSTKFDCFYQVYGGCLGSRRVQGETETIFGGLGRSGAARKVLIERVLIEKVGCAPEAPGAVSSEGPAARAKPGSRVTREALEIKTRGL